ncbi:dibenzothiophene desulfurization enzyme A [Pyrenophora tritici-repentis]|uniref:Dibenzothiophene desulfurization enzyme A n=2 Tax=Pyrenophora tritici-repentis TaxID=45151 RepID=A0A2W1DAK3_9PLEO|nr:dibenzothiophene desulfurization enzyme A [Pyrenophora tritici-repentis Pt-1C-BFP]KAA8613553.1 Dibenzothiophene desulfurization enzyme A [Pyrenophora tritici-repentis]EDU49391.1 dibenzothiophene desulfurization enzyme A [Pyrenophora tritici-repentis Pt-1C-BFP]KAF7445263.1 Dibenzothiophene desulfurization enzyme A [Pyrenophora tritici-repentis]KAF7565527.1 dibenzothiophene desulfurization enzyme A [Pyrenophora tritici-repentis]KAI0571305.1 Dibenzothiophene desulfurization enzyme A [Pyrenopho
MAKRKRENGSEAAKNGRRRSGRGKPGKKLIINAFVEMCSGHQSPGMWRHPDDHSHEFNDLDHWVDLAKLLEEAKVHGIFIADVLGGYDVYNGNLDAAITSGAQWPVNEPLAVISAMAAATKSIGFGVTVSTTYEQPYHLARRLSTVDHLTKGRLGWNIVTSYLDSAARNMGMKQQLPHDERYAQAEEYVKVMYKLFESSWRDDAVVLDRKKGVYTVPDRVRQIDHQGKYFQVPGPHICQPSPQRTPLILQAGASKAGKTFAAQNAEAIFVSAHAPVVCAKNIAEIREIASSQFGRNGSSIKFLALATPILGRTEAEAQAKLADYRKYASLEGALALFCGWTGIDLGKYGDEEELRQVESNAVRSTVEGFARFSPGTSKWTKHTVAEHISIGGIGPLFVGTPSQVADGFQTWVDEADVDGFNIAYALFPQSFKDVVELLLPELKKRGMFWEDYAVPSGTYRENFYATKGQKGPLDEHVASTYRWKVGVDAKDHIIPE